jgi:N-acylmannosamine kinase
MMFLTVSTGIGGGVILGGTLWVGSAGFAGHVGHILADPTGPVCGCGRVGCLEAVASGKAIAREGTRIAGKPVNAKEVFALAKEGEAWAEALLLKSAERVAGAVADIKAMQDPELLVIGGSVGLNPTYLKLLKEMLSRFPVIYRLPLVAAHLGAEAGLVGAAAWAQIQ